MELYFIRHGQSANNAAWSAGAERASPDPELTETGQTQARLLASYLQQHAAKTDEQHWDRQNKHGFGLTHLYTSLMVRAVATGSAVSQALGLPLQAWVDLHEKCGIYWQATPDSPPQGLPGNPRSFFEQRFPGLVLPDWLDEQGWWNRPFEAYAERPARARRFLQELLARHGDQEGQPVQRVAVFSHGGFYQLLMECLFDLPYLQEEQEWQREFAINNCSLTRIDLKPTCTSLVYQNRVDFLPPDLIT